jgi:hypothetical protein
VFVRERCIGGGRRSFECIAPTPREPLTNVSTLPMRLQTVACHDCKARITDLTAHALACGSIGAQPGRMRLHTAMEVACRTLLRDLDPSLIVTDCRDAYPHDHGFAVNISTPEAINHHADAGVLDTKTRQKPLIDFTFTNAAGKSGKDGAEAGYHADVAKDAKLQQYAKEFPGRRAAHRWRSSAWSTTAAGARVRVRTGMPVRLQRTHGRRPIWSSLHLCRLFLDGFSSHWLSHSGASTHYAVPPQGMLWCTASTEQQRGGGTGSWPRQWLLSRLELVPGISHPDLTKFKKANTTLAHYTIQEGSCLPARTEEVHENKHHILKAPLSTKYAYFSA